MRTLTKFVCGATLSALSWQVFAAGRCCNNPTVWTFKNLDKYPIKLSCTLERSVAWAGKPIAMETETIKPGSSFKYTWDSNWYSDGMGMLPGAWSCKPSDPKLAKGIKPVKFSTDWGENVTVSWRKERFAVSSRP
jgi:hypothetical protein